MRNFRNTVEIKKKYVEKDYQKLLKNELSKLNGESVKDKQNLEKTFDIMVSKTD